MSVFNFICPKHPNTILKRNVTDSLECDLCHSVYPRNGVIDYLENSSNTASHYAKQWGKALGYVDWIKQNPSASRFNLGKQLGWPSLVKSIRKHANTDILTVYDAACGFGSFFWELIAKPSPINLHYLGADIQDSITEIEIPKSIPSGNAVFIRHDISLPPPTDTFFDYVICRAALHHTPLPEKTLRSLVSVLAPGGTLALSVYTRKSPMREAVDDDMRSRIVPLESEAGYKIAREFAVLGRDLQKVETKVLISEEMPTLGIHAGEYGVQEFIYNHLLKCWFNKEFGLDHSVVVNYDWYHPEFAYRYSLNQIQSMLETTGLKIISTQSNKYQHYLEATKF